MDIPLLGHIFTLLFVLLHIGLSPGAFAGNYTWIVQAGQFNPDGFSRSAALVNGQFPGPVLTATKGENVTVNVINLLADPTMRQSTSIHWHGIFQARNSENDGPSFVTQCPIAPNHNYTYQLQLGEQAGTFWYHSHLGTQYVDGIRGAIVIYDPNDPQRGLYDVDDPSTIITLADWYHGKAEALLAGWRNNGNEPAPDSGLINGIGRYQGGPQVRLARINVTFGRRYRFRLVGLSADGFFDFAIAGHNLTVIEADGIAHKPYLVDSVIVAPAQRYSAVVTANQPIANYWIRATQTIIGGLTSVPWNPNFNGNDTYAVLHYLGAPDAEPTGVKPLPPSANPLLEYKLQPLDNAPSPGGQFPDNLVVFNFTFNIGALNGDIWTVNGIQYESPPVPTLLNILANGFRNSSQFGPNENTFVLPRNATVEINFLGIAPVSPGHAFHLHGHAFSVIQSALGPVNFKNPPRRDTVISATDAVRVRFRTDNPGPWFVHCHIDWHLETGLAVVFAEDPNGIASGPDSSKPNAAWFQLCSIYDKLPPSQQ